MYKGEVINIISSRTHIPKVYVTKTVDVLFDILSDALTGGDPVTITGFGVFETRSRGPRTGRNPHTGEAIDIPARLVPDFKPAKSLKAKLTPCTTGTLRNSPTK